MNDLTDEDLKAALRAWIDPLPYREKTLVIEMFDMLIERAKNAQLDAMREQVSRLEAELVAKRGRQAIG